MATISRQEYNNLFGPTVGDKIRLGDTDLYVEIEKDLREYGDEVVYGGGKTIRDGMGLANTMTSEEGALDLVITNVTIIDANLGVVKADVGVKDGKIAGIGGKSQYHARRASRSGDQHRNRRDIGRAPDPDGSRHRRPRAHDLPAAGLRLSEQRYYDPVRRRNRPYGRQ